MAYWRDSCPTGGDLDGSTTQARRCLLNPRNGSAWQDHSPLHAIVGEKHSKVNHVGIVVTEGGIRDAVVVEALIKVREHKLWKQYGPPRKDHVAVYRATNLTPEDIEIIMAEAVEQVGKPYGFGKIIAHFLDWLLTGAYFFRRLTSSSRYPICSWLVAHAYSKAGKHFGVSPGVADPDDIWDFVDGKPKYYERIVELGPMTRFTDS